LFALLDDYEQGSDCYPEPQEYIRKKIQVKSAGGLGLEPQ